MNKTDQIDRIVIPTSLIIPLIVGIAVGFVVSNILLGIAAFCFGMTVGLWLCYLLIPEKLFLPEKRDKKLIRFGVYGLVLGTAYILVTLFWV